MVAYDEFGRVSFAAWDRVGCSCAAPGIQPSRNTGNLFLEINGFMLNVTDSCVISPATG